jgi:PAS domain S-box-containing protein
VNRPGENQGLHARFGGLLEAAPDGILIVDAAGRIVLFNSQVETLFGYSQEELLTRSVEDLVPERFRGVHPHHRAGYVRDPRRRPMGAGRVLYGRRKDGSEFPAEISLSSIEVDGRGLTIAAVRDATERVALNDRLRRQNAELEEQYRRAQETSRLKSEFLANMSHKLKQALYNYLSNALKFTPEGGRVSVRVGPDGPDRFLIEVQDSGIGIKHEDQRRLFVEFQQLDAGTAKKYPGTGLGLALTKRIVEAQGGKVGVRSVPGQASTFFAVLPRQPVLIRAGGSLSAREDRDGR